MIWTSPAGNKVAVPAGHRDVSPRVVRDLIDKLVDLPKGWLQ